MIYVVTGKLGSGKSLVAVGKIRDYLNQGRVIATNLDLYLENLINPFSKNARVIRLPDKPSAADLAALPQPYSGEYSEDKTGLMVLDELGTWFNSRTWSDKGRAGVIDWFLHARKLGWDVIFIIQNVNMMDSQAREGLAELVVHCRRLDRFSIPFIGFFFRCAGVEIRPPKIHIGVVKYGAAESSPVIERWVYMGHDLYDAYDTRQVFSDSNNLMYSMLPPNVIYGRYTNAREHSRRQLVGAINRLFQRFTPRGAFLLGLLLAVLSVFGYRSFVGEAVADEPKQQAKQGGKSDPAKTPKSELDGVFITGSVRSRSSFDYVFEDGTRAVYPENMGYDVRYISACRAALKKDSQIFILTCSPYATPAEKPQPREGAAAAEPGGDSSLLHAALTAN
jgi:hypothetical protein